MMPYTDYTVRLGDLKRAIMKNPYDPNLNIDGYMRYLKYNTPSAQPDRGYIEQIKWERDLAIRQLKDIGYGLGEKPRTQDYKTDHGYMWLCPKCGLTVHSDFEKCVRCGYER